MPKVELETIDGLPEPLQGMFQKADSGRYVYDPEQSPEVAGLRQNKERLLHQLKTAQGEVSAWRELGLGESPDDALGAIERFKTGRKSQNGDGFEAEKTQLIERHKAEIGSKAKREEQLLGALKNLVVENAARAALEGTAVSVEAALPHVLGALSMVEKDGQFIAAVVDKDGQARYKDGQGNLMEITDLIGELRGREALKPLFRSDAAGGAGTRNDGKGGPAGAVKSMADLKTAKDHVKFIADHGEEAYYKLPMKAG